jgi:aspartyl-tRNA(Asn)/glutamyl-tRNA(Gln) amidotransferase subunit C
MIVDDALIQKLAGLSKLQFKENEQKSIKDDLNKMIGFVQKLDEIQLDGVKPLTHMSGYSSVLREDVVEGSVSHDEAIKNAPASDSTFFLVPKVIKK